MFDLWSTDGTIASTHKRVELNTFFVAVGKGFFLEVNGELFFTMDTTDNIIGRELYKYNVAQNAITLVKYINPSTNDSSSRILFMTKFDNQLSFKASNGVEEKLYVSDGTNVGTVLVENALLLNYFDPRKL